MEKEIRVCINFRYLNVTTPKDEYAHGQYFNQCCGKKWNVKYLEGCFGYKNQFEII